MTQVVTPEEFIDEQILNSLRDQLQEDPMNDAVHKQVYEVLSGPEASRALIDFYRQLQRSNPDDWRHLVNLARAYSETGKDSLAVVQLQKLLRSDPSLKEVWMDLARCYQRLNKIEVALRALNSAIDVDPAFAVAHIERVRLLAGSDELEEAAAAVVFSLECEQLKPDVADWLEEVDAHLESGFRPPEDLLKKL